MGWLSLHMLKVRNAKFMQGLLDLLLDNMVSIFISLEISLKVAKQQGLTSIQERGLMEDPKSQKQMRLRQTHHQIKGHCPRAEEIALARL